MTLSTSIQRAAAWVRAAVSGGELPSYQRSREELGGVPWRRFDQTDRWFLTSAHELKAASVESPLGDEEVSAPLALELGDSAVIPLVPPPAPPVPVIASAPPPLPVAVEVSVPVAPVAVSWDLPAPAPSLPSGAFDLRPSLVTPRRLALAAALVLGLVGLGVAMRAAPPAPIATPVAVAPVPAPARAPGIEVAQLDRALRASAPEHRLAHRKPHRARRGHR